MSKWPEPRPIAEAPDSAVLGWCPGDDECDDGWDLCYPSLLNKKWINREGDICHPTHFLPLTRLESAALRLYAATKADRERSAKMARLACERESADDTGAIKPCWKPIYIPGRLGENLGIAEYPSVTHEGGESTHEWCEPCQQRQKLYEDKSVRKELGNAKRALWAACKAKIKEIQ